MDDGGSEPRTVFAAVDRKYPSPPHRARSTISTPNPIIIRFGREASRTQQGPFPKAFATTRTLAPPALWCASLRAHLVAGVTGGFYVIGGYLSDPSDDITDVVERYDATTDKWRAVQELPDKYVLGAAAAAPSRNGIFLMVGLDDGWANSKRSDEMKEYNTATDVWATKTSRPDKANGMNALAYEFSSSVASSVSNMYAIGGNTLVPEAPSGTAASDKVHLYASAANSWTSKKRLPKATCWAAASVVNSWIYVAGGHSTDPKNMEQDVVPPSAFLNTYRPARCCAAMRVPHLSARTHP